MSERMTSLTHAQMIARTQLNCSLSFALISQEGQDTTKTVYFVGSCCFVGWRAIGRMRRLDSANAKLSQVSSQVQLHAHYESSVFLSEMHHMTKHWWRMSSRPTTPRCITGTHCEILNMQQNARRRLENDHQAQSVCTHIYNFVCRD